MKKLKPILITFSKGIGFLLLLPLVLLAIPFIAIYEMGKDDEDNQ